jgi:hypothetical protein
LLNSRGYKETIRLFSGSGDNMVWPPGGDPVSDGRKAARMVDVAARYGLSGGNCLSRSLVLFRLLRQMGMDADIRLAANLDGENFSAHAWVELDGVIINDRSDVDSSFSRFEARGDSTK